MRRQSRRAIGLFVLGVVLAAGAWGEEPTSATATYESLGRHVYQGPVALPTQGIRIEIDDATWELVEGSLYLGAVLPDGTPTGLVFEGRGRFTMPVPDPRELYQLRRFMEQPEVERVDEEFSKLVLRTSTSTPLAGVEVGVGAGTSTHGLAEARHQHWLKRRGLDADARLLRALLIPDDRYVRAEMDTAEHGWLTWELDAQRLEEVHLNRLHGASGTVESWLSLERREDRGIPRERDWRPLVDIEHVEVAADLSDPDKGSVVASVTFDSRSGPLSALPFDLTPTARVDRIEDDRGRELPFFRALVDKRGGYDDTYTTDLLVLPAEPIADGERHILHFHYQLDLERFAGGTNWYPRHRPEDGGLRDRHTARLSVTMRKNYDVRAMGELVDESEEGNLRTLTWEIAEPVKMMTFTSLRNPVEQRMSEEGVPEIVVFGPKEDENIYFNIAADLTNSIRFYQQLFDDRLGVDRLRAGMVTYSHGQAFEGFLHLAYLDLNEHPGLTQLFRGHEVAHQWWGHRVGWDRYRDQWLSEAFAEYSAMMFVAASMDNGEKLFHEIVRTYTEELTGSIKSAFSKFARPGVALLNSAALDRIGPIGHGWRATVHEAPTAYSSLAYRKGALVLHMLRGVLRALTRSDDTFLAILRDFVHTYEGDTPSTADFEAMVTKHAPADWSWFFEQWVYGCDIPTYRWDYEVSRKRDADGNYAVTLTVTQENVPAGFRMLVPVELVFGGGEGGRMAVMVDEREETVTFPVPKKPRKVIFNPEDAVLSVTKKK